MLAGNIIEPAQTEWKNPIVTVLKKEKHFRFCVEFRKLNCVAKRD